MTPLPAAPVVCLSPAFCCSVESRHARYNLLGPKLKLIEFLIKSGLLRFGTISLLSQHALDLTDQCTYLCYI